jgi:hypothetical protein
VNGRGSATGRRRNNGQGGHGSSTAPDSPAGALVDVYRRYLHLPDPRVLYTLLGSAAANMIDGVPVWLMLVGGPSSGKTALLESLLELPQVFELESPSGEGSFLSGTKEKDRAKDASGGDLREIGAHGAWVMQDFTSSILSKHPVEQKTILNVLRQCSNGRWSRSVGSDGGKKLHWQGRLGFFGGCTSLIETEQQQVASMGERWVYWRMDEDETVSRAKASKAARRQRDSGWELELKEAVATVFEALELRFNGPESGPSVRARALTDLEIERTVLLGETAGRCRTPVKRDPYSREVISGVELEGPARISQSLQQLLLGMELIGVGEADRWSVLRKLAEDSMPTLRLNVLKRVRMGGVERNGTGVGGQVTVRDLVRVTKCGFQTVLRAVEDLELLGMVESRGQVLRLGGVKKSAFDSQGEDEDDDEKKLGQGSKTTVKLTTRGKRDLDRGWPL